MEREKLREGRRFRADRNRTSRRFNALCSDACRVCVRACTTNTLLLGEEVSSSLVLCVDDGKVNLARPS